MSDAKITLAIDIVGVAGKVDTSKVEASAKEAMKLVEQRLVDPAEGVAKAFTQRIKNTREALAKTVDGYAKGVELIGKRIEDIDTRIANIPLTTKGKQYQVGPNARLRDSLTAEKKGMEEALKQRNAWMAETTDRTKTVNSQLLSKFDSIDGLLNTGVKAHTRRAARLYEQIATGGFDIKRLRPKTVGMVQQYAQLRKDVHKETAGIAKFMRGEGIRLGQFIPVEKTDGLKLSTFPRIRLQSAAGADAQAKMVQAQKVLSMAQAAQSPTALLKANKARDALAAAKQLVAKHLGGTPGGRLGRVQDLPKGALFDPLRDALSVMRRATPDVQVKQDLQSLSRALNTRRNEIEGSGLQKGMDARQNLLEKSRAAFEKMGGVAGFDKLGEHDRTMAMKLVGQQVKHTRRLDELKGFADPSSVQQHSDAVKMQKDLATKHKELVNAPKEADKDYWANKAASSKLHLSSSLKSAQTASKQSIQDDKDYWANKAASSKLHLSSSLKSAQTASKQSIQDDKDYWANKAASSKLLLSSSLKSGQSSSKEVAQADKDYWAQRAAHSRLLLSSSLKGGQASAVAAQAAQAAAVLPSRFMRLSGQARSLVSASPDPQDQPGVEAHRRRIGEVRAGLRLLQKEAAATGVALGQVGGADAMGWVDRLNAKLRTQHGLWHQLEIGIRGFLRYAVVYGAGFAALGAVTKFGGDLLKYSDALAELKAIAGATDDQMKTLSGSIKDVASGSKFSLDEMVKATVVLAQAGTSVADIPAALRAVSNFAQATGASLQVAADTVTTAKNVFDTLSFGQVADQLASVVNISKLTADSLQPIMSLGAQTAKASGLSLQQFLGMSGTLANLGIRPQTIATGTRQMQLEIFSPDPQTIAFLKRRYAVLGENLSEEQIKAQMYAFKNAPNPIVAMLEEFRRVGVAGEAGDEFSRVVDTRAQNVMLPLTKNIEALVKATAQIGAPGTAMEGAATRAESLSVAFTKLANAGYCRETGQVLH
jgi:hypothetical protein